MQRPWVSGLAQGEALSVFARAEVLEPGRWALYFNQTFDWLAKSIEAGGTRAELPARAPFLEEYPGSRHRHVLNGCLYDLVGIDDMLRHGERPHARRLFKQRLDRHEATLLRQQGCRVWKKHDLRSKIW